jgi:hypothetical protein
VSYAVGETSATCAACDTHFAIVVEHLSDGTREPRAIQRTLDGAPTEALVRNDKPASPRRVPVYAQAGTFSAMVAFICAVPLIGLAAATTLGGVIGLGIGASAWKYRHVFDSTGGDK